MKLSPPQQRMFQLVTEEFQIVDRDFSELRKPWQTAMALDKKGLVELIPISEKAGWGVRLSADWIRMAHLEQVINNVEGTPAERTKAHKAREAELETLYAKFR